MAKSSPVFSGNPKIGPEDVNVTLKFGGGLNTSATVDEIDPREATDGFNFSIDKQNRSLRNRQPFDLVGTVPNGQPIQGGGSLLKQDGTVSTLFQAGGVVYSWNGLSTFTNVGTCNAGSKLRGQWDRHNFTLSNKLLLTDLALLDTVKQWDGTTFSNVTFTNQAGSGFGNFFAKYLNVANDRAIWANIKDPGGAFPHMIVGSKDGDFTVITITNTPSSALATTDPFFLLAPDLKPINAMIDALGTTMMSTEKGRIFNLFGSTAKDFAFQQFYANSGAAGPESLIDIGNDMLYGRQGRLESVIATNTFANSASEDLTANIANTIAKYNGWTNIFNSRSRKVYCFPSGVSECWVMDTAIRDAGEISAWMRYTTLHPMAMQPTFVMSMLNPVDGLEYIYMGDSSGNIYQMEGTGSNGDGGTSNVQTRFVSKLFPARLDSQVYNVEGYVKYKKGDAATLNLTFQYQGKEAFDKSITINLPQASAGSFYGGPAYYGGGFYYGTIVGRLQRQEIYPAGDANEFQLKVEATGLTNIEINEIGLRFRAATN